MSADQKKLAQLLRKAATILYEEGYFDTDFIAACQDAASEALQDGPYTNKDQRNRGDIIAAREALEAIQAFQGHGPGGQLHPCYSDGIAANSIKQTYKVRAGTEDISGIKRWANLVLKGAAE